MTSERNIVYFIVSRYSPKIRFPFNVLNRLEAVMGIEIVSVLAKHSTELASSFGVKLKQVNHFIGLPDSQRDPERYVEEVISQWSDGNSHRPPTWEKLLVGIQDIDLLQLSQSIENFMKGKQICNVFRTINLSMPT